MEPLGDFIGRSITHELWNVNLPRATRLEAPIVTTGEEAPPRAFEIEVFNFLLANKAPLGLCEVWRCTSSRVDGLVDLEDGRRLAIEIKYRMNWEKACQACAQFGWYRSRVESKEKRLSGALVFFHSFSGDWARRKPNWLLENGWSFFYADHHEIDGLRVDLLRLRDGKLEGFDAALAAAQEAGNA